MSRPRRPFAIALNAVFLVVGLCAMLWPVTFGRTQPITCHGAVMNPGDVCHRLQVDGSDRGKVQTYEAARAERRAALPVIVGMGLLVAGFSGALLASELRRSHRADVDRA